MAISPDTLNKETDARFWAQTGYKPNQKLDPRIPTDKSMMPVWLDINRKVKGEAAAGKLVTTFDHPAVVQDLADAEVAHKAAAAHVDAAATAPDAATVQGNVAAATTAHQISKQKARDAASNQPPTVSPPLVKEAAKEVVKNPPPPQAPAAEHIAHAHASEHAHAHAHEVHVQAQAQKVPPASLNKETDARFWRQTHYKPGQKLDMSVPQDAEMAKIWEQIFRQVQGEADAGTIVFTTEDVELPPPPPSAAPSPPPYVPPQMAPPYAPPPPQAGPPPYAPPPPQAGPPPYAPPPQAGPPPYAPPRPTQMPPGMLPPRPQMPPRPQPGMAPPQRPGVHRHPHHHRGEGPVQPGAAPGGAGPGASSPAPGPATCAPPPGPSDGAPLPGPSDGAPPGSPSPDGGQPPSESGSSSGLSGGTIALIVLGVAVGGTLLYKGTQSKAPPPRSRSRAPKAFAPPPRSLSARAPLGRGTPPISEALALPPPSAGRLPRAARS